MLHSNILPEGVAVKEIIPFATKNLHRVLTALDSQLAEKNYMVDNSFTTVDIMIGYILMWYPEHVEPFINLKTYCQNLKQRPAYIRSKQD